MADIVRCPRHGGSGVIDQGIEDLMGKLPESQGGAGRHKCPYCSYLTGLRDGEEKNKEAAERYRKLRDAVKELLGED